MIPIPTGMSAVFVVCGGYIALIAAVFAVIWLLERRRARQ